MVLRKVLVLLEKETHLVKLEDILLKSKFKNFGLLQLILFQ